MNLPHANTAARIDWLRPLRYLVRVPLVLLHLTLGLTVTLIAMALFPNRVMASGERYDHRMIRWWSYVLMRIFGFHVARVGTPVPGAVLLVANHITWADIELIHSVRMACFVAKSEIERWPFVGWLASRGGTIFHRRGSTESLAQVSRTMVERLREGLAVAVFPEGGTGPGDHVRTFHARIFQAAIDAQVPAQPVALRFVRNGVTVTDVAFQGNERFVGNFFRVLGGPSTRADVMFLEPLPVVSEGRKKLAETARASIIAALGFTDQRRPREAGGTGEATDDLDPLASENDAA
jgi:lyso-ornithine lipid O-acyltransferase